MKRAYLSKINKHEELLCEFHPSNKISYIRMKYKGIIIATLIISLAIYTSKGTVLVLNNSTMIPDTLPESMQKVKPETADEDKTFDSMEEELNNLDSASKKSDTTKIRIGKMKIAVVEDGDDIIINKDDDWDNDDWDEDWTWKENDNDNDWTFHRKGNDGKFQPHWAGFAIGSNNYVNADGEMALPDGYELLEVNTNNSLEVNLNFAQIGLNIVKQRVGFVTGVGMKWNNYKFRNTNTVLSMDSGILTVSENPDINGEMSKLTTWFLTVPLLLEFQIPTAHGESFYLNAGIEGGLKLLAHTKIKTDTKSKYKDKNDFYTTSLDYRLTARLGYGNFGVYGAYSMMPLFVKDKGPELYPIAVGVSLNF